MKDKVIWYDILCTSGCPGLSCLVSHFMGWLKINCIWNNCDCLLKTNIALIINIPTEDYFKVFSLLDKFGLTLPLRDQSLRLVCVNMGQTSPEMAQSRVIEVKQNANILQKFCSKQQNVERTTTEN